MQRRDSRHEPPDADPPTTPTNHSPLFRLDESGLLTGLRAVDYLERGSSGEAASP